jgi:hypothetical protein
VPAKLIEENKKHRHRQALAADTAPHVVVHDHDHEAQAPPAYPRKVIRLAKLKDFFGLSHNQQHEVIKKLVALGWLSPPSNPTGTDGSARVVFADEVARVQQIGLKNALALQAKGNDGEAA